jgi:hypothetical protein
VNDTEFLPPVEGDCIFPVIGDKGFCIGVGEYAGVVDREFPRDNNIFAASVSSERTGVIDWSYSLSRVDWFSQSICPSFISPLPDPG